MSGQARIARTETEDWLPIALRKARAGDIEARNKIVLGFRKRVRCPS
jgi:hypothetical protein